MKKHLITVILGLGFFTALGQEQDKISDPVEYVNPLMGTMSSPELSTGNTYPAVGLPWGMNIWTPQTGKMGDGWVYTYNANKINGLKQTHQPSPWMNDYGAFAIMPVTGKLKFKTDERASWFSHHAEVSKPYYYSVYLADADVTAEITPTERAAQLRFTFPESDSSYVIIDAQDKGSYIKILPAERKILGYTTKYARGKLKNFKNYFVIYFNREFSSSKTFSADKLHEELEMDSDHSGAVIGFKTIKGEKITAKTASSFISFSQAELNLKRELAADEFDSTRAKAKAIWNAVLDKVTVEGGTLDQKRTFYSCMYRTLFFPNKLYEIDANQKIMHWSPYNGQVLPGYMFAGTGFWDTFRALYPFLNLVYPSINKEMQEGLINCYKEGGWLPEWSSPGYADIMIGNNSASVVAEAYIKGLRGYNIGILWDALKHGANHEGPIAAVGRNGVNYYNKLGYVPSDVKINESAAKTLEYAYDDFAIYQLGKALKKPESELAIYRKRAMNYRNLFDPAFGLMRGKKVDGTFQRPFSPFSWGGTFTEGNSWHYTWSVFQDIEGLSKLMGGHEKFVAKLDSVFLLPPVFDDHNYGGIIHEIREMQIANMGQYAHGNQPIQHMIYLYNYGGAPYKTQYWVRETMNRMYKASPDGFCGDEDNGQTSAWYVFSAMGFYPVTPATDQYVLGAPLFKKITLKLENGKTVLINASDNNHENRFVQSLQINGMSYQKNWISHTSLQDGVELNFKMGALPNKERGTSSAAFPYSLSTEK